MKYYIISGEASGDLHAANLAKAIKQMDSSAEFRAWGGDKLAAEGAEVVKDYKDLAFMGFIEVAMNIRTILGNIAFCKSDIKSWQPDVVIFVDYPGFNLQLAKFVHEQKIRSVYYISPQVWAWKSGRVKTIKKYIDQMLVILPFEKDWYAKRDFIVDYVGHPLLDAIENIEFSSESDFRSKWGIDNKAIIALLPGSRKQEITKVLPLILSVQEDFKDYTFVVSGAPGQELEFYKNILPTNVPVVMNETYNLLNFAHAAIVTSGTATLETALLNVPEVVVYKGSAISYQIAKRVVKDVPYISLVNLIMNEEVVTELIQGELNPKNLKQELNKLIQPQFRKQIFDKYARLREVLGGSGASKRAADLIVNNLSN